jgi:hypothetical protein
VPKNKVVLVVVALASVVGVAIAVERAIVTDEERIDELADVVSARIDDEHIDKALEWTDPAREPVEVVVKGQSVRFESKTELSSVAHAKLAAYHGERLVVLSKSIEVKGERATLSLDTFSRRGRATTDYELRKLGERWVVSRVKVR